MKKLIELNAARSAIERAEIDANWYGERFDAEYVCDRIDFAESYFTKEDLQVIYFSLVNLLREVERDNDKISAINNVKEKIGLLLE